MVLDRPVHYWDAGYAGTSLEDLMRVSGLGKGSLYAAFGDSTGAGTRRGCLLANSTLELDNADPEVLDHAYRTYETSTALIGDCVARAQREGDVPAEVDPIALARALLAAQQGLLFLSRTGLDAAALTATARSLADRLLPDPRDGCRSPG